MDKTLKFELNAAKIQLSIFFSGIIVFSVKENRSWKIQSHTMIADPSASDFTVNGIQISVPINIAGIALGPKIHTSNDRVVVNEDREVYFSPISSLHLFSINTSVLRNPNLTSYNSTIKDLGTKSSQSVGMIMDNQGILYYTLLGNNAVGKWDSHTSFQSGQVLIARDSKHLEWPNSLTFDSRGNLTVLMNRMNRFIYNQFDLNEYNFRLITSYVGGKSYLFDDNKFSYDSNRHDRMFKNESQSTTSEPKPEPQTESEHQMTSTTTTTNPVKIVKSSAWKFGSSFFTVILSFLVAKR